MKKLLFIVLILSVNVGIAQETLDKIAAIVDKEIILLTEVEYQAQMFAMRQNLDPNDPQIKKQILNQLIDERLIYAQAELDSIVVTDAEVDARLDQQMQMLIQQAGSRERLEQAYGISMERMRRKMRDEARKVLMTQNVKRQKFGKVEVTKREVEEFFEEYKDSLGQIPERFELSHIFINPSAGDRVKKEARDFAQSLLDSIKGGADFAELATEYSDDPGSKAKGGDLDFVKRGVFYPEFEAAAFRLNEGELSEVIESPVGYHIIELLEKRGDMIHTRHILIRIKGDDDADLKAIEQLTEIRDSIVRGGADFADMAKKYSDDKQTSKYGGKLGILEKEQLDKSLKDQVYKLDEGEIGFPKRLVVGPNVYGFHIVRLDKRTFAHTPDLNEDYNDIKRIAEFQKSERLLNEWIVSLRDKFYWEIKLED